VHFRKPWQLCNGHIRRRFHCVVTRPCFQLNPKILPSAYGVIQCWVCSRRSRLAIVSYREMQWLRIEFQLPFSRSWEIISTQVEGGMYPKFILSLYLRCRNSVFTMARCISSTFCNGPKSSL
jgi:hypothetical protein